jgi:hypothetical protein
MDSVHARFVNNSFAVFPGAQGTSQLLSILTPIRHCSNPARPPSPTVVGNGIVP